MIAEFAEHCCQNYTGKQYPNVWFLSTVFKFAQVSADRAIKKAFAETICKNYPDLQKFANFTDFIFFTDPKTGQIIYHLITKLRYFQKPTYAKILITLYKMKNQAIANTIRSIAMSKVGCGLHQMDWDKVSKNILDEFQHSGITTFVYASGQDIQEMPALEIFDTENVSKTFEPVRSDIVKMKWQPTFRTKQKTFTDLP